MDMIIEFINEYGTLILYTILTTIAGAIGLWVKKIYTKYADDKTKKDVVATCVKAVEQLYKDLHGEEKYNEVVKSASEMLAVKGISISEIEIKMLIEAAVGEFNRVFERGEAANSQTIENKDAAALAEDEEAETSENTDEETNEETQSV